MCLRVVEYFVQLDEWCRRLEGDIIPSVVDLAEIISQLPLENVHLASIKALIML